jgi:hypothetical protein
LRSWRIRSLAFALLAFALACTGAARVAAQTVNPASAGAPGEAIEQFMRMVAANDYTHMGSLFGTIEGPVTRNEAEQSVERRMYTIAAILKNDRFVIRDQQPIPGRGPEAQQLTVRLTQGQRVVDVPFVVVHSRRGAWLVEQIDLEAVTKVQ